eukprot:10259425-Ditylum_brightwellii.AAC.1
MYGIVDSEPLVFQCRTKSNPYLTFVNTDYPEENGGMFGLEVSYVSDIKHKKGRRQAYKIRANTTPMDFQAFKMTIPSEHEYTQFKDHCTILK